MTSYAAYRFNTRDSNEFRVRVAGHHTSHPLNWSLFYEGYSLEGIKAQAAIQPRPVIFIDEDGDRHDHGVQFSAEAFERAAYGGHVSYNLSMTDGYYAPEPFEVWVKGFRQDPAGALAKYNDFTPATGALEMYVS